MPSSITQLVVGIAVAFGVAVVSVGPIGSAGAQSPIEIIAQEALTNRFETPLSKLTSGSVIGSSSESIFLMGATGSGEVFDEVIPDLGPGTPARHLASTFR